MNASWCRARNRGACISGWPSLLNHPRLPSPIWPTAAPVTPCHRCREIQLRGMAQDLSWGAAAQQYEAVLLAAKYQW